MRVFHNSFSPVGGTSLSRYGRHRDREGSPTGMHRDQEVSPTGNPSVPGELSYQEGIDIGNTLN